MSIAFALNVTRTTFLLTYPFSTPGFIGTFNQEDGDRPEKEKTEGPHHVGSTLTKKLANRITKLN